MKIISFDRKYKQAFHDINIAWLQEYFTVEPAHRCVLENPESEILATGGEVFFALNEGKVIGAVAIRSAGDGVYELTKLGVDKSGQGLGAGRMLCEKVIEFFEAQNGKTLYLETHKSLEAALHLYHQLGFEIRTHPKTMAYQGCDLYMEWRNRAQ